MIRFLKLNMQGYFRYQESLTLEKSGSILEGDFDLESNDLALFKNPTIWMIGNVLLDYCKAIGYLI